MGKKIATWIIVPLMAAIFILDILTVVIGNGYAKEYDIQPESFDYSAGDDRIHFLNTGCSDAILLESNGRFALIDSGEGDSNPRRKTEYTGYSQAVRDYLKKAAGDESGEVYLDFILGTHCHYDHIGSFEDIIRDEAVTIGTAYFKPYNYSVATEYESGAWANAQTYEQVISALSDRGVTLISELPDKPFTFGDFTLTFLNTVTPEELYGKGENASSVGVIVEKDGVKAFLAADITKTCGLEDVVADSVGDVTLLKIGHHGYFGSSSIGFLRKLNPEVAVVTNQLGKMYPNVKWNLTMVAKCPVYSSVNRNCIVATFSDDGTLVLTDNAQ